MKQETKWMTEQLLVTLAMFPSSFAVVFGSLKTAVDGSRALMSRAA